MMLQTIWFFLWGILWAVYFMLDGFDLGLGTLMPFLAKDDTDRRVIYRAMGPFWDGNEVWLITAGGVTFAAFPTTYAVMFSGLYSALMLILFALILRGVSMAFRGEVDDPRWRRLWDMGLSLWAAFCRPCCSGWPSPTSSRASPSTPRASTRGACSPCSTPTAWPGASSLSCSSWCTAPCGWRSKPDGDLHRPGRAPGGHHSGRCSWCMAVIFLVGHPAVDHAL